MNMPTGTGESSGIPAYILTAVALCACSLSTAPIDAAMFQEATVVLHSLTNEALVRIFLVIAALGGFAHRSFPSYLKGIPSMRRKASATQLVDLTIVKDDLAEHDAFDRPARPAAPRCGCRNGRAVPLYTTPTSSSTCA